MKSYKEDSLITRVAVLENIAITTKETLDKIEKKLDKIDDRFERLENNLDVKFSRIDHKFYQLMLIFPGSIVGFVVAHAFHWV